MKPVVQSACPGCKKVLRIPAEWVEQPMKCKHCGTVFRARPRASTGQAKAVTEAPRRAPAAMTDTQSQIETEAPLVQFRDSPVLSRQSKPAPRRGRGLILAGGVAALGIVAVVVILVAKPFSSSTAAPTGKAPEMRTADASTPRTLPPEEIREEQSRRETPKEADTTSTPKTPPPVEEAVEPTKPETPAPIKTPPVETPKEAPAPEVGAVTTEDVRALLDAVILPPVGGNGNQPRAGLQFPRLSSNALAEYRKDEQTPFRNGVEQARRTLAKHLEKKVPYEFKANANEKQLKDQVERLQRDVAIAYGRLKDAYDDLKKLQPDRDQATRRWQANYDYVLARLEAEIVHVMEYNYLLGALRKNDVEAPDAKQGQDGWRLVPRDKPQQKEKEGKDLDKARQKLLDQMLEDYKGTPWEALAKREKESVLGLEWQAARVNAR